MSVRRSSPIAAIAMWVVLAAMGPPAYAEQVIADLTITSVRLTDRLVLRIEAAYVCPPGFAVAPSSLPRAYAGQQTDVYPSSQDKKFGEIVCDGAEHEVLVRFLKPRHPHGARWEFDALTQVRLTFQVQRDDPYLAVGASDTQMVTTPTGPSGSAQVAADITVRRLAFSHRHVIRVRATYVCPRGFGVDPALPAHAFLQQEIDGRPLSRKTFEGIECDGTRRDLLVRFPRPRQPEDARWEPGALTRVSIGFQAHREDPYLFVLAADSQVARV